MDEPDFQEQLAERMERERLARKLLGVSDTAAASEIKKAFWVLAMEYHPDRNPKDEEAQRKFRNLVNAYDFLLRGRDSGTRLTAEEEDLIGKYKDNEWGFFCNWRENFMDGYFPDTAADENPGGDTKAGFRADSPFDQFADRYDRWFEVPENHARFEAEALVMRQLLGANPDGWLEVGVGTGRFAEALKIRAGIDPSVPMLKLAQARGIQAHCASGELMPYTDAAFAGILMVVTLCFLSAPEKVFAECNRVLKNKGALLVGVVPAGTSWQEFYSRKAEAGHPFYRHAKFYTCEQVMRLAAASGFAYEQAASTLLAAPGELITRAWKPELDKTAGFVGLKFIKEVIK